ncbi:MAG: ATP-binding protein [Candidatus Woesearchaeota archaeon]
MYDVIVGRNDADKKKIGDKGTIFLGKHYVKMGRTTSLSNNVYIDVTRAHVFFIVGKRGSGKSYTMGVIAEGISDLPEEIKNNISVILLDTMGIYWTMKYANQKDKELLKQWGLKSKALDIKIFTPSGFFKEFKKKGIPTDFPFSVSPSELDAGDWCMSFGIPDNNPVGVFIERIIYGLKGDEDSGGKKGFIIEDIISEIDKNTEFDVNTKNAAKNLFMNAKNWGIFGNDVITLDDSGSGRSTLNKKKSEVYKSVPITELAKGGQITVLDLSCYATMPNSWNIKNLVVGLVAEKLFVQRMTVRKDEEYAQIHKAINLFGDESLKKFDYPMVWLVLDEAHEFLPVTGKRLATDPLVTILREGRQPGISLILATQQPGKIHTDVMTQADVVIAHRITAKLDTEALGSLMQSYMREGLVQQLDDLPREKGAALIFDDSNERMYPIKLRPRFTWHGGEDPSALPKKEEGFEKEEEL